MWLDSWCWQPHISVFLIGFRGATRLASWHHWWSVCVCLCVCVCAERLVVFADKRWYGDLGHLCGWIPHSPMVDVVLIWSTSIWGVLFPFSWCTCASCMHGEVFVCSCLFERLACYCVLHVKHSCSISHVSICQSANCWFLLVPEHSP